MILLLQKLKSDVENASPDVSGSSVILQKKKHIAKLMPSCSMVA